MVFLPGAKYRLAIDSFISVEIMSLNVNGQSGRVALYTSGTTVFRISVIWGPTVTMAPAACMELSSSFRKRLMAHLNLR